MQQNITDWHTVLPFFASELFAQVQQAGLFEDSKTFADVTVKSSWQEVIAAFAHEQHIPGFTLEAFVNKHFVLPEPVAPLENVQRTTPLAYVESMWNALTRQPDASPAGHSPKNSLIALAKPYIVPGGRFREIYYWDSYFTALGLMDAGREDMVINMLDNFVDLIAEVGCIPNGNRAYYHTRSQPPVLALMYHLVAARLSPAQSAKVNAALHQEYAFWMEGEASLSDTHVAHKRVVRMPDGKVLNRYYDNSATPRPESWREDIHTAKALGASSNEFYRHIRAACESGWDFSSRWLAEPTSLASIRTTEIVPVDLNALLYTLEQTLSELSQTPADKQHYQERATARQQAIQAYLWQQEYFYDYHYPSQRTTNVISAAAMVPLFTGLATTAQAKAVKNTLVAQLLKPGGVVTTALATSQQWDTPNGWAPLQFFTTHGLIRYGYDSLAADIMQRFVTTVERQFAESGVMMEKYNVCEPELTASGGEYAVQLGFGWTNGVYKRFKNLLGQDRRAGY